MSLTPIMTMAGREEDSGGSQLGLERLVEVTEGELFTTLRLHSGQAPSTKETAVSRGDAENAEFGVFVLHR